MGCDCDQSCDDDWAGFYFDGNYGFDNERGCDCQSDQDYGFDFLRDCDYDYIVVNENQKVNVKLSHVAKVAAFLAKIGPVVNATWNFVL